MPNGRIAGYELFVSRDNNEWGKPAAKGTFQPGAEEEYIMFAKPQKVRYLRFVSLSGFDNQHFAASGELIAIVD